MLDNLELDILDSLQIKFFMAVFLNNSSDNF